MEERGRSLNTNRAVKRLKVLGDSDSEERDHISDLKDDILLHILSLMPTVDAVRTGVLSKRWVYLWTYLPRLQFYPPEDGYKKNTKDKFCSFVDKVLFFHKAPKITLFHLTSSDDFEIPESKLNSWIRFATQANIEELELFLSYNYDSGKCYKLPLHIYDCSTLRSVSLCNCEIRVHEQIKWNNLKALAIQCAELSTELMNNLLSGSPLLEVLDIHRCLGIYNLVITSSSLKKLIIEESMDNSGDAGILKIEAPCLESLSILGSQGRKIELLNMHSIIDVNFGFWPQRLETDEQKKKEYQEMLRKMMEMISHVTKLTLSGWNVLCLPTLLKNCKKVMLNPIFLPNFSSITALLKCSPELEELTIDMRYINRIKWEKMQEGENYWSLNNVKCLASQLKTVDIQLPAWLIEDGRTASFIKFLLKEAAVLEKMIIEEGMESYAPSSLDFARKLLAFPKASPHVVILFC